MSKPSGHIPRVAILVDTSTGWGRRMIRGITNFVQAHQSWHIWVDPRDSYAHQRVPDGWPVDGVIARVHTPRMVKELHDLKVPVVNVSGIELPGCQFPRVLNNHVGAAKLVAEYFIECGHTHFAHIGPLELAHVTLHYKTFEKEVATRKETCRSFDSSHGLIQKRTRNRIDELDQWLRSLIKPVGIFCWSVREAMILLERCREVGVAVPDEVAVLTGDDDPLLCNLTSPTLSGLVVASEQIGFYAAQRLSRMMQGIKDEQTVHHIDPVDITTRGSTDAMAITDPELARAIIFMRQNVFRLLTVDDIANFVPMSRRSLERKFRTHFGRSPLEELRRLRLARVRQLLSTTDMPVAQIAEACGFGTPEYMTVRFHQDTGITPLRYRAQSRSR